MARQNFQFTSESVSEGHPDKVCDRISDEIVDLFFREGARAGLDPYQIRVACETLATTNRVVIAGEVRGPKLAPAMIEDSRARGDQGHRLRAGRLPLAQRRRRGSAARAIRRHRPGRRRRRATRTRAPATRASCSAMPAAKRPELMPAPLYYAHKILHVLSDRAPLGQGKNAGTRRQEPGDRALRERQAGRGDADRGFPSAHGREPHLRGRRTHHSTLCPRGAAWRAG